MGSRSRPRSRGCRGAVAVAAALSFGLIVALPLPVSAHHDELVDKVRGEVEWVSLGSSGSQGNGDSGFTCGEFADYSASDNGRIIAFASAAGNLHPADVNGQAIVDIFVRDRASGSLEMVSRLPSGLAPELPPDLPKVGETQCFVSSRNPVVSGNGRYVAFTSDLSLAGADHPENARFGVGASQVFVRDLKNGTTELVSRTWNGDRADRSSGGSVAISDSGRFVSFPSRATNMVEKVNCGLDVGPVPVPVPIFSCGSQIYVRDRKKNTTSIVSVSSKGDAANDNTVLAQISGNGRFVAFESGANNLVVNDDNECRAPVYGGHSQRTSPSCPDVFVHDRASGKTELVTVARDAESTADHASSLPTWNAQQAISDDGRYVLFYSHATDLVPSNSVPFTRSTAYVRDRRSDRTERVSISSTGAMLSAGGSHIYSISDDGRYVLLSGVNGCGANWPRSKCRSFQERQLDIGDGSHEVDGTGIYDRETGQTDLVDIASLDPRYENAPPANRAGSYPAIGANGRFMVFNSPQTIYENDTNDSRDLFVREIEHRALGTIFGSKPPPPKPRQEGPPLICIEDTCIPPQSAVSFDFESDVDDILAKQGAKLHGASLAYRPEIGDLFVAIELEHMGPALPVNIPGIGTAPTSSIMYGLRFEVQARRYEVRASSLGGGTFGLFDCTDSAPLCTQVTTLKGGYGTTGERAVFSLPLKEIGLENGGNLKDVVAFSALGSDLSGALKVLDRLRLK